MKNDLSVKNGIVIPADEIEITAARSGGPGGQHVNKTSSAITVRWNVKKTNALNEEQKERVMAKLHYRLTIDGDLIINNSSSRSQHQNKDMALARLAQEIRNALHVPKKRIASKVSKKTKEIRLQSKARHGAIKKMRSKKIFEE